jgi:hypothetical protein
LIQLYRWFPSILQVLTIIRPETLVRWHRAGFRRYWRWKSCPRGGRPQINTELRALIRQMSIDNSLWGAPRIHGELLKLGFELAQSSVAKYMVKRRGPPSQGWRTFLRNHAPDIAAMDLFVVPTIGFDLLYAFVIVRLDRRDLVWINVTKNPTAEWVARQITEAFPWDEAPKYLIRDHDRIYGTLVARRLRAMGIRDKPTAPASPAISHDDGRKFSGYSLRRKDVRRHSGALAPDRGVPYTDVVGERKHSMLRGRRRLLRGCQSQDRSKDRKQGNEGAKNLSAAPRGFRDGAVSHGYRPT